MNIKNHVFKYPEAELEQKLLSERKEFENAYRRKREEVVTWLAEQDVKYHLTITFKPGTKEDTCKQLLNTLLKHLNRKIFNREYKNGKQWLKGIAVLELTKENNTGHFHILLLNHNRIPENNKLDKIIKKLVQIINGEKKVFSWTAAEKRRKRANKYDADSNFKTNYLLATPLRFTYNKMKYKYHIDGIELQDYYNDGRNRLERYLTKNLEKCNLGWSKGIDSIGLLGPDKVVFGRNNFFDLLQ